MASRKHTSYRLRWKTCERCLRFYHDRPSGVDCRGIITRQSDAAWSARRFCSRDCFFENKKTLLQGKICTFCGKTFFNYRNSYRRYLSKAAWDAKKTCNILCGNRGRRKKTCKEIFMRFIGKQRKDSCLRWLGAKSPHGHGVLAVNSNVGYKNVFAHRLSYALFVGPVPGDKFCCHECGNAWCVNPRHLYLGDYPSNNADWRGKQRPKPGVLPRHCRCRNLQIDRDGLAVLTRDA